MPCGDEHIHILGSFPNSSTMVTVYMIFIHPGALTNKRRWPWFDATSRDISGHPPCHFRCLLTHPLGFCTQACVSRSWLNLGWTYRTGWFQYFLPVSLSLSVMIHVLFVHYGHQPQYKSLKLLQVASLETWGRWRWCPSSASGGTWPLC